MFANVQPAPNGVDTPHAVYSLRSDTVTISKITVAGVVVLDPSHVLLQSSTDDRQHMVCRLVLWRANDQSLPVDSTLVDFPCAPAAILLRCVPLVI